MHQNRNPGITSFHLKCDNGKKPAINKSLMNKIKRPFEIKITNASEIRMGSPYSHCDIELAGFDKIKLPKSGWQDKFAWTDDSKKLVLIKWDFENNDPGFHLFHIDIETGLTR